MTEKTAVAAYHPRTQSQPPISPLKSLHIHSITYCTVCTIRVWSGPFSYQVFKNLYIVTPLDLFIQKIPQPGSFIYTVIVYHIIFWLFQHIQIASIIVSKYVGHSLFIILCTIIFERTLRACPL